MTGQSRYLTCAGYEIHFMDWGDPDAPPVIMWHGMARTGRDFDTLAEALSDRYRVVCPDTIGRGMSQWAKNREADYCFAVYADIAVDLVDRLGFKTVRWVGTSMGGLIGVYLAANALSKRISHLFVNDVGPEVPAAATERIGAYVGAPPAFDTVSELEQWLRTIYTPFGDNPDSFWQTMTETSYRRLEDGRVIAHYDPKIVTQFTAHRSDLDLWAAFDAVTCPTLLLRGENSDVLPRAVAEQMVARGRNCDLKQVSGYGHAPTLNTDEQIAMVREFLES